MRAGLEAFAAARRTRQDQAIADLTPKVAAALDNYADPQWWRPLLGEARGLFNDVLAEDSGGTVRRDVRSWAGLSKAIADTLPKTGKPDEHTATTIATWLSTATINAAAMAAANHDPDPLVMEWVTMHDSHVRTAHKDTDGQQRPIGEPFDVDGHPMLFPGDPTAPIDLWINCRCALAPQAINTGAVQSLNAAAGDQGIVIVALPAPGDPVNDLAIDQAHLTLVWLGTPGENPDLNLDEVRAGIEQMIEPLQPFTAKVEGIDNLGPDDSAMVWMLNPDSAAVDAHSALTQHPSIGAAWAAVKQFPVFQPHVTIGYDLMLSGDGVDALSSVKDITFDRLALWNGSEQQEYPLSEEPDMPQTDVAAALDQADAPTASTALRWHGILAPEGVWSGDGRMFAPDSLRFRDLPLPLTWQRASGEGHDGSVVIAKIEAIERIDGMMRGEGSFVDTPETDEAVGLLAEFGKFGVSVDADDAEFEFAEDEGENQHGGKITFTSARIASASMVAIPAFSQAFIALGTWADAAGPKPSDAPAMPPSDNLDVCDPDSPNYDIDACAQQRAAQPEDEMSAIPVVFVSDTPWSQFSPGDYSDQQWKSACCLHLADTMNKSDHKLPIKEPGGALNRNGVHAAAGRFNQVQAPPEAKAAAARTLRGAYSTLGEDPPDAIKAAGVMAFGRGPGWLTNPEDTKRLHDYWTVPGQPGYAKIGWGTPGDFNRCKDEIGQEIAEKDPATVAKYMNQICSQWHHDATGFWPGQAPAERASAVPILTGKAAPALSLVAAVEVDRPPAAWFANPELSELTHLTVTEDGQVFGHLCGWETCHVGFADTCVAPPQSATNYAYFRTGQVLTDAGAVNVGQITLGGGHAAPGLRLRPALAHYDSTSAVVADVACGEDEHGVWLAGAVRPGTTPEQIHALRAADVSGDWREVSGGLELIAALAVNTGGFPVPRVAVESGTQVSLVAAGMVEDRSVTEQPRFDADEFAERVAAAIEDRAIRRARMAALRQRVGL